MIEIIKKILFFTLILLITSLSGYFFYKSYIAYQNYQIAKESEKYTLFIKNINIVLIKIEQESSLNALYLGTEGNLNFNQLEDMREKTDNAIKNITTLIKKNSKFSQYSEDIVKLSKNLQYARSRVDVLSPDYKDILFVYYQDEIFNSLLNIIKNSANELSFGVESLKKHLFTYVEFINFRNNIEKEKSFITFIISQSKKMDKLDLMLWDKIIAQEIIPNFTNLDEKTTKAIKTKLQLKSFYNLIFKMRVDIAKGANKGNYFTSIDIWHKNINEKIRRVKQSEQLIFKYLKDKSNNIVSSPKEIILYAFVSLFLIFLLLSILSIKKSKNSKITRKKIIKNIPIDDRRESKKHISHTHNMFDTNMILDKKNLKPTQPSLPVQEEINEIDTFNALKEFNSIVELFVKTTKKDIKLNYYIDPTIPTSCIGDFSKIKKILENIINYALNSTKAYDSVEIHINTNAENKKESAISFKITAPNCYINKEQKQIIMKAFYQKSIPLSKQIKSDLVSTSKLISLMDGVFGIDSDFKKGTIFSFTLSVKKSTS